VKLDPYTHELGMVLRIQHLARDRIQKAEPLLDRFGVFCAGSGAQNRTKAPIRAGARKDVKTDNQRTVHHLTDSGSVLLGSFEGNLRIGCWKKVGLPVKLGASEGWESGLIRRS
jgi:hypothetical protein